MDYSESLPSTVRNEYGATHDPPPPINEHTWEKLMKLKPSTPEDNRINVFAYLLNKDIVDSEGRVDDLYGLIFPLGSFSHDQQDKIPSYIENIEEKTGLKSFVAGEFGLPIQLRRCGYPKFGVVHSINVDCHNKVIKLQDKEYESDLEKFKRSIQIRKDVFKEIEDEEDPDNIEYFKRRCYLMMKNKDAIDAYQEHLDEVKKYYDQRKKEAAKCLLAHPDLSDRWLPYVKEKLDFRDEMELYRALEHTYNSYIEKDIRDEMEKIKREEGERESTIEK